MRLIFEIFNLFSDSFFFHFCMVFFFGKKLAGKFEK